MVKPSVLQPESLPDQGAEPFQQLLQESLQHLLEGQMTEFIGAVPGERTQARTGYRAGHVKRRLATCAGLLELHVPRDRAKRFSTDLFERYPRQETAFISELGQVAAEGLTTAKVSALAEALCGHALPAPALDQFQEGLRDALARHAQHCSAICAQSLPGSGPSVVDDTPAAVAQEAPVRPEREAVAAVDCTAPVVPDLETGSYAPSHAHRGRIARWMTGLGGTLVAAGLLFLGMRLMGEAPPEFAQAAVDFSGTPDHAVHAVHAVRAVPAVHVGRMDPMALMPAGDRPEPAALVRVAASQPGSHLQLTGVVATNPTDGGGLALIAIGGGLARVVRVGESVDGDLSLQAVGADRAMLGPAGGPVTLVLEVGSPATSPRGVLRAEGGQRSWAGAVATAPASDGAETVQAPTVLASNMLPPMTVAPGALQPATSEDLMPAAVPAGRSEFQGLSHSERRRLRRLSASK